MPSVLTERWRCDRLEMNVEHYWEEMLRYYSNIVGKYGNPSSVYRSCHFWISGRSVDSRSGGVNMQQKRSILRPYEPL